MHSVLFSNNSVGNYINVKLPKLELRKFDGYILQWQGFRDQFNSAVHQNDHLSDIQKFSYLKSFLTSSASSVLSGLTLIENNYKEAVILLKQRYSNEQVLVL